MGKKIAEMIGDGSDLAGTPKITYAFEDRPLGTAGGVKNVEKMLEPSLKYKKLIERMEKA